MRYSIVFFAALLGYAAATQAGGLQDREVHDVSALQERAPVIRPPGWKGIGVPYPKKPFLPKGRPSRPKRLRNLDDLEERDLLEDSISTLQERAPVMRPPGWKGIGIPYPKKPILPKGRPSRPKRLRNLEELEERSPVMRPPGWKGIGVPYRKTPFLPKGRPTRRKRDLDELEGRGFQRRALPGPAPRRMGSSGSRINRPYYKGLAAPRRRPRDVEGLDERDLYDDA